MLVTMSSFGFSFGISWRVVDHARDALRWQQEDRRSAERGTWCRRACTGRATWPQGGLREVAEVLCESNSEVGVTESAG